MSDFIYNNFPPEPDDDNNNKWSDFDDAYSSTKSKPKANIALLVVCIFFGLLLILTTAFGMIIIDKLSSGSLLSNGKQNVDSLIFAAPTTQVSQPSQDSTPKTQSGGYQSIAEVVTAVKNSVVEVESVGIGAGSGVVIGSYNIDNSTTGYYIVTNAHVIQDNSGNNAENIIIRTTDGTEYQVSAVRGADSYGDIAVLMVNTPDKLTGAEFGDSSSLVLGEEVIAIGNPLGKLGGSVTNGIISALDREIEIDGNVFNLLQTNAAINSGNSGGGLFDMNGKLIGIVNAKSSGLGIEGIGFAIPSNDAKKIVNDIIQYGYVRGRPYIGVTISLLTDRYSSYVYIHDLDEGYNDSVLKVQDIILSLNGENVKSLEDFRAIISTSKPGDTISAYIKRGDEYMTVTITVHEKGNN